MNLSAVTQGAYGYELPLLSRETQSVRRQEHTKMIGLLASSLLSCDKMRGSAESYQLRAYIRTVDITSDTLGAVVLAQRTLNLMHSILCRDFLLDSWSMRDGDHVP